MRSNKALAVLLAGLLWATGSAFAGPALLFDPSDGRVLYAEDADDQWHPASLTKIMTAYLTFEALKAGKITLETKITCSEAAHQEPPSKVGLPVGADMTVDLALQALIVKSANDVAVMLAEAVGGSQQAFVEQMNATAKRLGMTRTKFVNPNGLPAPEQVTTARDLAKLARAAVTDFPEYAHYWAMEGMHIGKRRLGSHNLLLKTFEGADGLKTGFICDSGYNVVASATRDGHRLMAVVLGAQTGHERAIRAASLLEHGFQQYGWTTLFNTTSIDNMPIAPDAKGITTMRETVAAWECGRARRLSRVARARHARAKAAAARAKAAAEKKIAHQKKTGQSADAKGALAPVASDGKAGAAKAQGTAKAE